MYRNGVGIVVVGRGTHGHFYVLQDASGTMMSDWPQQVSELRRRYDARVVLEDESRISLIEQVLRVVDPSIPIRILTKTRGRASRIERAGVAYQSGRVRHVGSGFVELEDQLIRPSITYIPDRIEALVLALSALDEELDVPRGFV